MIKSAFLVPHSPILIPAIGKANYSLLEKTILAFKKIEDKLIADEIDTIVVISPHQNKSENGFNINIAPEFKLNFTEFGDYADKKNIAGDLILAQNIKEAAKGEINVQMSGNENLDYGSAIPLFLLTPNLKNIKIIIISQAEDSLTNHYNFGKLLKEELHKSSKNIAILASGDMSHRLKKSSPAGYSPKGAKFDNKIIEFLNQPESAWENISQMDQGFIDNIKECGLKSIAITLGALEGFRLAPQVLAYQNDLGIGYLTLDFGVYSGIQQS